MMKSVRKASKKAKASPESHDTDAQGTLLYVEDNPANLRLMEETVRMLPQTPRLLLAVTAEQGMELAKETKPDLIILDLNLPGMSGFDALKRLRKSPKTRKIPMIALTASAMPTVMQQCRDAGFNDILTKPVDVLQLISTINSHLAHED